MCNHDNTVIIDGIVQDWTNQGRAFTAFEVSLEAKQKGATERHRDMRSYVHQAMSNATSFGNYQQSTVSVGQENGQTLQAILYHPQSYDPTNYKPLPRKGGSAPALPAPSMPSLSVVSVANNDGDDDEEDDKSDDGGVAVKTRLLVPTRYFREAGIVPGATVFEVLNGKTLRYTTIQPMLNVYKVRTIERNGDIRIGKGTLTTMGWTMGSAVQVEVVDDNGQKVVEVKV